MGGRPQGAAPLTQPCLLLSKPSGFKINVRLLKVYTNSRFEKTNKKIDFLVNSKLDSSKMSTSQKTKNKQTN